MLQSRQVETAHRVEQLRAVVACTVLAAVCFLQQPGQLSPDTKLDLLVAPARFLGRSLHLWEPDGFFGQVQNQGYGYLFPIGPFFLLGRVAGLPPWVVQRLWWTLLLCLAFVGTVRVAKALGIGTSETRLAAGLTYALAPHMITVLGAASVEALPSAVAPWVLLPLVLAGAGRLSPTRAALLSGVAVLCAGAVNATATLAVLPLPALWLLTRRRSRGRMAIAVIWAAAVVAATTWWVVPLVLLGRYSPPFVDYIESASVTTGVTAPFDVLRGTSHWVAYLGGVDGPVWPAGNLLLSTPMLVLDTAVLAGLGLAGLCLRRLPERTFLVLALVTGVVLVGAGHVASGGTGVLDAPWSGGVRALLDGALAPLRNVHKFDLVLRLPLALGLAHAAAMLLERSRRTTVPGLAAAALVTGCALLAGAAGPALADRVAPPGSFTAVPGYWSQTADFLAAPGHEGRALLLPSSRFGTYYWGRPRDEPLQPLARTPWGVRDAVPLAPAGHIRWLDEVSRVVDSGAGSPGLAEYLSRAGVRWVVVRNDLDWVASESTRPVLVHAALARSGGFTRVATFGPMLGGGGVGLQDIDQRLDRPYPAVEVYETRTGAGLVDIYPARTAVEVSGGPESLLALAERRWVTGRPTVLAGDAVRGLTPSVAVVTDGMRRRERFYGGQSGATSAVLARSEDGRLDAPARDYLPWSDSGHETTARITGVRRLTASSSTSDAGAFGGTKPEHQPFAAVDGDPSTSWLSAPSSDARGQWLDVELRRPAPTGTLAVYLDTTAPGARVTRLRVTLGHRSEVREVGPAGLVEVRVVAPVRRLRLTAVEYAGRAPGFVFGIRQLSIPGLTVGRTLVTPQDVPATAGVVAIALDSADNGRAGCVRDGAAQRCAFGLARPDEDVDIDRTVTLPAPDPVDLSLTVRPRSGAALSELLSQDAPGLRVASSSSMVSDPSGDGQAAADGDLLTGWVAYPYDRAPTLSVILPGNRVVTGLQLRSGESLSASAASVVEVTSSSGTRTGEVEPDGVVRFAPLRVSAFRLRFPNVIPRGAYDPEARQVSLRPVGVSELTVLTPSGPVTGSTPDDAVVFTPCGQGPDIRVGRRVLPTRVTTALGSARRLEVVRADVCGPGRVTLPSGETRVRVAATPLWQPMSITADPLGGLGPAATSARPTVQGWATSHRTVTLAASTERRILVLHENENAGWRADLAGRRLQPVVVDGWQQGYLVPAGLAGQVTLEHGGERPYRAGLLVGLLLAVLLVVAAAVAGRSAGSPTHPARPGLSARLAVAGLGGLAVGGWPGLVLVVVAVGVLMAASRSGVRALTGLTAAAPLAAMAAAGGLAALRPWGSGSGYLGDGILATSLTVAAVAVVLARWAIDGSRPRHRMAGSSTRR
jgi:arabinofuranan 3-O-arabinosyltransferase